MYALETNEGRYFIEHGRFVQPTPMDQIALNAKCLVRDLITLNLRKVRFHYIGIRRALNQLNTRT